MRIDRFVTNVASGIRSRTALREFMFAFVSETWTFTKTLPDNLLALFPGKKPDMPQAILVHCLTYPASQKVSYMVYMCKWKYFGRIWHRFPTLYACLTAIWTKAVEERWKDGDLCSNPTYVPFTRPWRTSGGQYALHVTLSCGTVRIALWDENDACRSVGKSWSRCQTCVSTGTDHGSEQ